MTLVQTSTGPAVTTAPDLTRRGRQAGPADTTQSNPAADHSDVMPLMMLVGAIALSLGSNVFAVLQLDSTARSFGGVVYGAWPTLAFLGTAWLWHRAGRRGGSRGGRWRASLIWVMRLAVAIPAAYVSLLHVHATAQHFGQAGAMSWAEAVGMEAVTALCLVELDAGHAARRRAAEQRAAVLERQELERQAAEELERQELERQAAERHLLEERERRAAARRAAEERAAEVLERCAAEQLHLLEQLDVDRQASTKKAAIRAALKTDLATLGEYRPTRDYAAAHGASPQYVNQVIRELEGARP